MLAIASKPRVCTNTPWHLRCGRFSPWQGPVPIDHPIISVQIQKIELCSVAEIRIGTKWEPHGRNDVPWYAVPKTLIHKMKQGKSDADEWVRGLKWIWHTRCSALQPVLSDRKRFVWLRSGRGRDQFIAVLPWFGIIRSCAHFVNWT